LLGAEAAKALRDVEAEVLIPEALTLRHMSEMGRLARDWEMSGHADAGHATAMDHRDRPDRMARFKASAERSLTALHDSRRRRCTLIGTNVPPKPSGCVQQFRRYDSTLS
jgi:hypothetical protein